MPPSLSELMSGIFSRRSDRPNTLCRKCLKFARSAISNKVLASFTSHSLGSKSDVEKRALASGCACCRLVLKLLDQDPSLAQQRPRDLKNLTLHPYRGGDGPTSGFALTAGNILTGYIHARSSRSQDVSVMYSHDVLVWSKLQRAAENDRLDILMIKSWIEGCELFHGGCCFPESEEEEEEEKDSARAELPVLSNMSSRRSGAIEKSWADGDGAAHSLLLIDVEAEQLVNMTSRARYVTLSYVWGDNVFQTVHANLERHKQRGFFRQTNEGIPLIYRNSMKLVQDLGERYLWIDALCIVQDSPGKAAEFARMDMIYGQSVLTIVAMSATSARDPLPRVDSHHGSPPTFFERTDDGEWEFVSQPPPPRYCRERSVYETRGWTFQEKTLSKRRLYVTHQQAYFECSKGQHCEVALETDHADFRTGELSEPGPENPITALRQFLRERGADADPNEKPSLFARHAVYQSLVSSYTQRKLTKPTDILNAFAGIAAALVKMDCEYEYFSGMPWVTLELALLWTPSGRGERRIVERRAAEPEQGGDGGMRSAMYPTWSWAGWTSPVEFLVPYSITSGLANIVQEGNFIVEWDRLGIEGDEVDVVESRDELDGDDVPEFETISPTLKYDVIHAWADTISAAEFWEKGGGFCVSEGRPSMTAAQGNGLSSIQSMMQAAARGHDPFGLQGYSTFHPKDAEDHGYDASTLEFVLLSRIRRFPPLAVPWFELAHLAIDEAMPWGPGLTLARAPEWQTLNVMLVTPATVEGYLSRVAVGHIHQSDWAKAACTKKYVRLA